MLVIRLRRTGKRNQPLYRIVVAEKRAPLAGRYVERVGFYNPRSKELRVVDERARYWLAKGAQPSLVVHNLLARAGIFKEKIVTAYQSAKKAPKKAQGAPQTPSPTQAAPRESGKETAESPPVPAGGGRETEERTGREAEDGRGGKEV